MNQDNPKQDREAAVQREVTRIALAAVDQPTAKLRQSGYQVEQTRRAPQFADCT